jgi:hypothetical protein
MGIILSTKFEDIMYLINEKNEHHLFIEKVILSSYIYEKINFFTTVIGLAFLSYGWQNAKKFIALIT